MEKHSLRHGYRRATSFKREATHDMSRCVVGTGLPPVRFWAAGAAPALRLPLFVFVAATAAAHTLRISDNL